MKKKDLVVIIFTVIVAAIFSYLICSKLIGTAETTRQSAEIVKPITAEFNLPSSEIFNSSAVNPTKLIVIGPNANEKPFANQ